METPTRLYIARPVFIDAVVAKQVLGQLFDPRTFGRVWLDLCQALAQESGSLCEVCGPGRFPYRLSGLEVLNPKRASVGPAVDCSLTSVTSVWVFHRNSSLGRLVELLGLVLERGVQAHNGHTEWPDPRQMGV